MPTSLKQGSRKDVQGAVLQDALNEESSYPIVQSLARMDFSTNQLRTGGFDKGMQKSGLGLTASQVQERLGRLAVAKALMEQRGK